MIDAEVEMGERYEVDGGGGGGGAWPAVNDVERSNGERVGNTGRSTVSVVAEGRSGIDATVGNDEHGLVGEVGTDRVSLGSTMVLAAGSGVKVSDDVAAESSLPIDSASCFEAVGGDGRSVSR
jgi:hypothetical protein